eukprot:TRINITY_DN3823_c1_g1_i4.p1 TRINITY_DN3823_c1_g1~~TRINITY_DN3823_c1_g1_i4.p1  ORF type:complete len:223 (-),score=71.08 TRINITY_DN3823_c1_g1_i4:21-689(-)
MQNFVVVLVFIGLLAAANASLSFSSTLAYAGSSEGNVTANTASQTRAEGDFSEALATSDAGAVAPPSQNTSSPAPVATSSSDSAAQSNADLVAAVTRTDTSSSGDGVFTDALALAEAVGVEDAASIVPAASSDSVSSSDIFGDIALVTTNTVSTATGPLAVSSSLSNALSDFVGGSINSTNSTSVLGSLISPTPTPSPTTPTPSPTVPIAAPAVPHEGSVRY